MRDSCEPFKLASGHDDDRPNRDCDADKNNRKKLCHRMIRVHSLSVVISSVLSHARNARNDEGNLRGSLPLASVASSGHAELRHPCMFDTREPVVQIRSVQVRPVLKKIRPPHLVKLVGTFWRWAVRPYPMGATARASVVVARPRPPPREVSCESLARQGRRRAISSIVAVAASTLMESSAPCFATSSDEEISSLRAKAVDASLFPRLPRSARRAAATGASGAR